MKRVYLQGWLSFTRKLCIVKAFVHMYVCVLLIFWFSSWHKRTLSHICLFSFFWNSFMLTTIVKKFEMQIRKTMRVIWKINFPQIHVWSFSWKNILNKLSRLFNCISVGVQKKGWGGNPLEFHPTICQCCCVISSDSDYNESFGNRSFTGLKHLSTLISTFAIHSLL